MAVRESFDGDLPRAHPSSDLFGYFPFAQRLAKAIVGIKSSGGVVLAVTGEWGSGKSTLLNFVKRELSNVQVAPYPAIIEFNPWWFSSRDDLAPQMIRALRDRIAADGYTGRDILPALTKYADSINSVAEYFGPLVQIISKLALGMLDGAPQSFSKLKQGISKELAGASQKYVFFIDDIDRLAPSEVTELLRAVKAIGDFPNVVYVLAFDRKIVAESVKTAIATDGDAYLEKIVQAIFPVPAIDRLTLRRWLFEQLDAMLSSSQHANFDESYWAEVYFDGLDSLFRTPRDVIRFVNTILITYPSVSGEVNVVDFIAVESLRMFSPRAYEVIRDNPVRFTGRASSRSEDHADDKGFHDNWMDGLKDAKSVARILSCVFPKFGSVRTNYYFSSGSKNWRHAMRVCDPENFPTYFQFATPAKIADRALLGQLKLAASQSDAAVCAALLSSVERRDAAGVSQIRDLIDRLADDDEEISSQHIPNLISGLLQVGDEIVSSVEGKSSGVLEVPIEYQLIRLVSRLISGIPPTDRIALAKLAFTNGRAVSLMVWVVGSIQRVLSGEDPASKEVEAFKSFDVEDLVSIQGIVASKFGALSADQVLVLPGLNIVVNQLLNWREAGAVRSRLLPLLLSEQSMPLVLERLASSSRVQSSADPKVRTRWHLDPRILDRIVDHTWMDYMVESCTERSDLSDAQIAILWSYLQAREELANGGSIDKFWDPDD